ncbi:MAG: pilus assembly protein PilM [Planctomycetota bacterium]
MRRAFGIEIGDDAVTCVQLVRRGRGVRVASFCSVPIEEECGEREALAKVAAEQGLTGKKIALSLPASRVYLRSLASPMKGERAIRSTIKSQVEALVPVDMDAAVADFARLSASPSKGPGIPLLAIMARKDMLREKTELLKSLGVRPARVGVNITDSVAMAKALPMGDGRTLLLDLGAKTCNAVVLEEGGLAQARTLRVAAGEAGPPDSYGGKIVGEMERMLKGAGIGQPDRVIVSGGASLGVGVMLALEGLFPFPVSALDLASTFMPGSDEDTALRLNRLGAAAFGAAYALLMRLDGAPDLLQEEFAGPRFAVKARRPVVLCAVAALLACLVGNAYFFHSARAAQQRLKTAQTGLDNLWRKLYPNEAPPADIAGRIRIDRRRLAIQDRESLLPARESALDLLLAVVKRMPREKIVEVARVNVSQEEIQMDVRAASFSAAQEIAQAVGADPQFSASVKDLKPVGDNTFAFQLSIAIRGEAAHD